jgi:predicted phosphoribosyltransferase
MFKDRVDGAHRLASLLEKRLHQGGAVVLSIPRGGIPVGGVIARRLGLPLDVIAVRKIRHPHNPEYAVGALSLTSVDLDIESAVRMGATREYLASEVARVRNTLRRRHELYRGDKRPLQLAGGDIILADDGAITGRTLKAAIKLLREAGASRVTVAIPVAPQETVHALRDAADEVICPVIPPDFGSIGQFYRDFSEVSDEQALAILRNAALTFWTKAPGSGVDAKGAPPD